MRRLQADQEGRGRSRPGGRRRAGGFTAARARRPARRYHRDPRDAMNLVTPRSRWRCSGGRPRRWPCSTAQPAQARAPGRPSLANTLGLSGRGVLENNRGYALLKLGPPRRRRRSHCVARSPPRARPLAEATREPGDGAGLLGRRQRGGHQADPPELRPPRARLPATAQQLPGGIHRAAGEPLGPGRVRPVSPSRSRCRSSGGRRLRSRARARSSGWRRSGRRATPAARRSPAQDQAAAERGNELVERTGGQARASRAANAVNQSDDEPELGALQDRVLAAFRDVGTHTSAFWSRTVPSKQRECLFAV